MTENQVEVACVSKHKWPESTKSHQNFSIRRSQKNKRTKKVYTHILSISYF